MSTVLHEAFATSDSVSTDFESSNSTVTQTLSGSAWSYDGVDQVWKTSVQNSSSNPGNIGVSQEIAFVPSADLLNYFGFTPRAYTTVDSESISINNFRVRFSGNFQSATSGLSGDSDYTVNTSTYHKYGTTTYSFPTYQSITVSVPSVIYSYDGVDEFANIDYRVRVSLTENTSNNLFSGAIQTGPKLVGTATEYWAGSRFIIDGLDGDTAPEMAVEVTIQEQSVNAKSASCTMSADFACTQTAKNLVGFPGVITGRYVDIDYFTTENNYIASDYVEVGYVVSNNYMEVGEGVEIEGMEQILQSDFTQPVTLAGLSILMDALTVQSDWAIASTPGYLISAASAVEADTTVTALGGIIIDSTATVQTESLVTALGGIIIDNTATVQSESVVTALGGLVLGVSASLQSDSFATIQARANLVGEIELVSQFGFNFLEGTRLSGEATLSVESNLASTTRIGIQSGEINLQTESVQSQTAGVIYQISESLLADFDIQATEITDIVFGSAVLNAGSFQLTTGRNWLIDRYFTLIVEDENRDFQVLPETRIQVVPDENGAYYIKTENRAIKAEQETRVTPSPIGLAVITTRRTERV